MKRSWMAAIVLASIFTVPGRGACHCEVPCGIYDDSMRLDMIVEDAATIEKGMKQIEELSADPSKNMNQIVRWVQNKDLHADRIKETAAEYFLSQRVKKPAAGDPQAQEKYVRQLVILHDMTLAAMMAKQTTDLQYPAAIRTAAAEFREASGLIEPHTHERP